MNKSILLNYWNTFDATASKWVRKMTEEELIKYGYLKKSTETTTTSEDKKKTVRRTRAKTSN